MIKLLSIILFLVSCTPKLPSYDLIYFRCNRMNSNAEIRDYFGIKLVVEGDSMVFLPSKSYLYLDSIKKAFVNNKFLDSIKIPISNDCLVEFDKITNYKFKKYNVGDTFNKCIYLGREEGFLVKRGRFDVVTKRWKYKGDEMITFFSYSGNLKDSIIQIERATKYTYYVQRKLLFESVQYENYNQVEMKDIQDTIQLVAFRKLGKKKWNILK